MKVTLLKDTSRWNDRWSWGYLFQLRWMSYWRSSWWWEWPEKLSEGMFPFSNLGWCSGKNMAVYTLKMYESVNFCKHWFFRTLFREEIPGSEAGRSIWKKENFKKGCDVPSRRGLATRKSWGFDEIFLGMNGTPRKKLSTQIYMKRLSPKTEFLSKFKEAPIIG